MGQDLYVHVDRMNHDEQMTWRMFAAARYIINAKLLT